MVFLPGRRSARRRTVSRRFARGQRRREAFAGKLVQAVVGSLLGLALIRLLAVSLKLSRRAAEGEGGSQSWLLPGLVVCFFMIVLWRVILLWKQALELWREMRAAGAAPESDSDE